MDSIEIEDTDKQMRVAVLDANRQKSPESAARDERMSSCPTQRNHREQKTWMSSRVADVTPKRLTVTAIDREDDGALQDRRARSVSPPFPGRPSSTTQSRRTLHGAGSAEQFPTVPVACWKLLDRHRQGEGAAPVQPSDPQVSG